MAVTGVSSFQHVLASFKTKLDPKLVSEFEMTSLKDLKRAISVIQNKQASERRVQNMRRLSRFLEGMEQYGKVIEVFLNVTDFLAFVWVASNFTEAFSKLLDTYEVIGESLPLLNKCQGVLENTPYVYQALESIYLDILEFHEHTLRYFTKPMWKQIFQATWPTYKSRFERIVTNLNRHKQLLEGRVTFSQLESVISTGFKTLEEFEKQREDEKISKHRAVQCWLRSADVETDQETLARVRSGNPETGNWLFCHGLFQTWQDSIAPTPLLWLSGIPGAGKSVLASLITEKCRKATSQTTVWFYCRHGDKERNTFIALARSLISQLLQNDMDLLPYIYEKMCSRGEQILSSEVLAKDLLETLLKNCRGLYMIIDGVDECSQTEEKKIIQLLRSAIEISNNGACHTRSVFISQRDAVTTKLLHDLPTIAITSSHNRTDIIAFVSSWALEIQHKFCITDEVKKRIIELVVEKAQGMFLFAKLVMPSLFSQISRERLFEEINNKGIPNGLEDAYSRILSTTIHQTSQPEAIQLLAWLLKWREIQAAVSIDLEDETVDFHGRQWMLNSKDLCGSLVETRTDGSLELVHTTAKFPRSYLINHGIVNVMQEELKMASLCLGYLGLPGFEMLLTDSSVEDLLKIGYYAFLDYAACYWPGHLEASLVGCVDEETVNPIVCVLQRFLDSHYREPGEMVETQLPTNQMLDQLQEHNIWTSWRSFTKLRRAFISTQNQIQSYGEDAALNDALDIPDIVARVRGTLEYAASSLLNTWNDHDQKMFNFFYGDEVYKCPRMSCDYFHRGFKSPEEREVHIQKHTRPFCCSYPGCLRTALGFLSKAELRKHIAKTHETAIREDRNFSPNRKKPVLQCSACQQEFLQPAKFRNHRCENRRSLQQVTAQKQPENGIPMVDDLSTLSAQDLDHVSRLANEMLNKANPEDIKTIQLNLSNMTPEQRDYLARKNLEPMTYFFRSQALNQIRRHRRARLERGKLSQP
ncbi:hypothetical protein N7471_001400 [Penicillium samsonianum]|uniref:uncharacterized protein n=1 Tax=Penicillium samsonianum TaxID=1882272 RepID=UPI002546B2AF|nr:uncharacterized protein N7471_001400 [Penicillium samsonianum]KAJ6150201.1 hypothetical protein N7471_001400 [Penicillium samsonianum]